ncbi:MAG: caspase family protein [Pseudomonadota bacterium]
MAKKAICIGINDYPGSHNDLNGCVNDMNDWAALLTNEFGYDVSGLADAQATASEILSSLTALIRNASAGDALVFTFSGHGSYVLDGPSGDEADNYDETIVAFDRDIVDDEIRDILDQLPANVGLTVICDSCHSGSVTRATLARSAPGAMLLEPEHPTLARYMPKDNHGKFDTIMVPRRNRSFGTGTMNHI